MQHTLSTPPPGTAMRRGMARMWDDPETRSTLVGIAGVVIFYLFLWLVGPHLLRLEPRQVPVRTDAAKQFDIEIAPDAFLQAPEKPPEPFRFVETNPDAPENTPDKTQNFGAQNQQVAQETPTPDGTSDRPATEGRKDFESTQIVSGQLTQPIEELEAVPETVPMREAATVPRAEQNPLPGYEKHEGEDKTAVGSNVAKFPENVAPVEERVEGAKVAPLIEGVTGLQPVIDPRKPQPRPQLVKQPRTRPAILAENKFGTENIGNIAVDARWSEYGAYLSQLLETVQFEWERILISSKVYPPSGSTVTVKFVLNDEGKIARIVNVESTSSESARHACVSAITNRAPYGAWTKDMKATLGSEQEMTFTFHYQ